jgi:hypothetical protein
MTYDLLLTALNSKSCVSATYKDQPRSFAPHCLGSGPKGELNVLGFQYAGASSGPLPSWRCFRVDGLQSVEINSDEWTSGPNHSKTSSCIATVHAQVAY